MIFIDTNIFLRYFEREDESTYRKVERLFTEIVNGNIIGISTSLVIAEVIWGLYIKFIPNFFRYGYLPF
ncbi:unnamed protein product [marine sediment metagenome]|uniref:PIN domain-containing protein n=1 Tax=marine sediment metagenome TaxID=412755 RepID=X1K191_9ZZZZ